jgi:hypothetical protein
MGILYCNYLIIRITDRKVSFCLDSQAVCGFSAIAFTNISAYEIMTTGGFAYSNSAFKALRTRNILPLTLAELGERT